MESDRGPGAPGSKVRPPPLEAVHVARPALIAALDDGVDDGERLVAVISGPAGYGKTSLLSEWFRGHASDHRTAWVTLADDDRNATVFWSTALTALATALPEATNRLAALKPDRQPERRGEFLAALAGVLHTFDRPLAVALDEAHRIEGTDGDDELLRLIDALPARARLAVATRSAFALQGARITGRLVAVRQDTLSFTKAETTELIARHGGAPRRADEIQRVTEGWPEGVVHGVRVLERLDDPGRTVQSAIDYAEVFAYFEREVMSTMTPDEQTTLLTTAFCPVVTPDLVQAMTGFPDGGAIMMRLLSMNSMLRFVATDDRQRSWYRVHPVFAHFAKDRSSRLPVQQRSEWFGRAARWHRDFGDVTIALRLAVTSEQVDLVIEILRSEACRLIAAGRSTEILTVVAGSRIEARHDPLIDLYLAFAAADSGQIVRAEKLSAVQRPHGLAGTEVVEWDWLRYTVLLTIARNAGRRIVAPDPGPPESTLREVPDDLRQSVLLARSFMRAQRGWMAEATPQLVEVGLTAATEHGTALEMASEVGLAVVALASTKVRVALRHAENAVDAASSRSGDDALQWSARGHSIASWCLLALLRTTEAHLHADAAIRDAAAQNIPNVREEAEQAFTLAHFDELADRRRIAYETTVGWPGLFVEEVPPVFRLMALHSALVMSDSLREEEWGTRMLERAKPVLSGDPDWQVASALHLYRSGRPDPARTLVAQVLRSTEPREPSSSVIVWALESVLASSAGNASRAHSALVTALELADETGYIAPIIRVDPSRIGRLLRDGRDRFGDREALARTMMQALPGDVAAGAIVRLTARERELLAELRTLRTVEEIASDLSVSVNTVKTHVRGVYRKLSVSTRREAVKRAEELGLL